ncbi:hypothetical protein pb186bvf_010819 [Paramecium bursaria]
MQIQIITAHILIYYIRLIFNMNLTFGILKFLVSLQAFSTFLLGIGALIFTIIMQIKSSGAFSYFSQSQNVVGKYLLILLWSITGFLLSFGLLGIYGSIKHNKCLIFLFNIGNVIIFICFLIVGLLALLLGGNIDLDKTKENCLASAENINLNKAELYAEGVLCQKDCQCYYTGNNTEKLTNFTQDLKSSSVIKFQQCNETDQIQYEKEIEILTFTESTFGCSGWCNPSPIFFFTNINKQVQTQNGCYYDTVKWFANYADTIGVVALSFAGVLFLFILLTTCLFCSNNLRESQKNKLLEANQNNIIFYCSKQQCEIKLKSYKSESLRIFEYTIRKSLYQ